VFDRVVQYPNAGLDDAGPVITLAEARCAGEEVIRLADLAEAAEQ